jgi:DNA-binding ferritin-like protein
MKDLPRFNNFLNEDIMPSQQNASLEEQTSDLVSELMNAATSFHKLHLKVKDLGSFAAHSALQTLYDALPEHADTLAESFQGATEKLLQYREFPPKVLNTVNDGLVYATQLKEMVNNLQSKMPYSEIVNDLDLVKSSINAVKYKLIFLK